MVLAGRPLLASRRGDTWQSDAETNVRLDEMVAALRGIATDGRRAEGRCRLRPLPSPRAATLPDAFRTLNIVDEFARVCPGIRVDRTLNAIDMTDALSDLFILRSVPEQIRSNNGREFVVKSVQAWITGMGAKTASIAPGSPWENGDA